MYEQGQMDARALQQMDAARGVRTGRVETDGDRHTTRIAVGLAKGNEALENLAVRLMRLSDRLVGTSFDVPRPARANGEPVDRVEFAVSRITGELERFHRTLNQIDEIATALEQL